MKVRKVFVKRFEKGGMLGFCDVGFSLGESKRIDVTWKGCKLFQRNDDGGRFVILPQVLNKKDGKYYDVVGFGPREKMSEEARSLLAEISEMASGEYQKQLDNAADKTVGDMDKNYNAALDAEIPF